MENFEEQFYVKLGMITHNQSKIEYSISSWIIKLIANDDLTGLIVTSEMSFKNLMNCLGASLSFIKDSDEHTIDKKYIIENYTTIQKLISSINSIEQERNTYIHSIYHFVDGLTVRNKITAKSKGLKEIQEIVDIKKLEFLIDKQIDANNNIVRALYEEPILLT